MKTIFQTLALCILMLSLGIFYVFFAFRYLPGPMQSVFHMPQIGAGTP